MTPDRYQLIGRLYHQALEHEPDLRNAFLDQACAGDQELRKEIESLIASHEQAAGFIEEPAFELAAMSLARTEIQPEASESVQVQTDKHLARPRFFWIAISIAAVVFASYFFSWVMLFRYGSLAKDLGWQWTTDRHGAYISEVDPQGAATGSLEPGDRVVAINGEFQISSVDPWYTLRQLRPATAYPIRVRRGETVLEYWLAIPELKRDRRYFAPILARFAVSAVFYLLGLIIAVLKPADRSARPACLAAFAITLLQLEAALRPVSGLLQGTDILVYWLMVPLSLAAVPLSYDFFYRFPPGVPEGRLWSFFEHLLYWSFGILALLSLLFRVASYTDDPVLVAALFNPWFRLEVWSRFASASSAFAAIAMCAVIVRNHRLTNAPDQRRRLRWVILGSVAGVLPVLTRETITFILVSVGQRGLLTDRSVTDHGGELAMAIVPIALGYAIVKHRLFDINLVIRRGIQYLLARNALRIILAIPLIGLVHSIVVNPRLTVSDILFHNRIFLLLIAAGAVSLKFRPRLIDWLDRRFFREAYDQEQVLIGLIDEIKDFTSISEITSFVSRRVDTALHPSTVCVFYRQQDSRDLEPAYRSGVISPRFVISASSELFRLMEGRDAPQEYEVHRRPPLPADQRSWLDRLGVSLLVPVTGSEGRLMGLLLLGEKKSEQPYTYNDRRLLQAIAHQIAVTCENVLLKEQAGRDAKIKRDVLAHLDDRRINLLKECPSCGACFDPGSEVCPKDLCALTLTLPVERTIDGKYRLEQLIGKGGMASVYRATDLRLARQVAVKIMTGTPFGDQDSLRRFEREARASAKLSHPNIVAVFDYGRTSLAEGAFLVMELVPGGTLRSELVAAAALPSPVVADWFDQVLDGVNAAHGAGVIHRDLKPENILIIKSDHNRALIKVLDFGLAKLKLHDTAHSGSLTAPGVIMGTINYMSPEQLAGDEVDERSDIFALGVIIVEALTGSRPFAGATLLELQNAILRRSFNLEGTSPEVVRLDKVLQRCLAKDPRQRYSTVGEVQKDLIPAIRGLAESARLG